MKARITDCRRRDRSAARWGRTKGFLGRHAARHPVLAAMVVLGVVVVIFLGLVLTADKASHRAVRVALQNTHRLQRVQVRDTQILKEVAAEQKVVTDYLKVASPASRERIKIECEQVNVRFTALGEALRAYHPTPGTNVSMLVKNVELALTPTNCSKLASIGPKPTGLDPK